MAPYHRNRIGINAHLGYPNGELEGMGISTHNGNYGARKSGMEGSGEAVL
jgi:hypothetical protein